MSQPPLQLLFSTKTNNKLTPSLVSIVIRNRIQMVVPQSKRCTTTVMAISGGGLYSAQQFELTLQNVDTVLDDVRPYLIADGGNVDVVSVQDGIVSLKLQGACGSCPSSTTTTKMGIERVLKEKFRDAVKDIVQVFYEQPAETSVETGTSTVDVQYAGARDLQPSANISTYTINSYNDHQCRKSIPASIKESRPEVAAVSKIGQQLWIRNYAGVYDAIRGFNWNAEIQEFIASFEERYTRRMLELLMNAYSTLSIQDTALFFGIYRLGDSWYPVEAGDAIWMPPFVYHWTSERG